MGLIVPHWEDERGAEFAPRPLLWVPRTHEQTPSNEADRFVVVTPGYSDIVGESATWGALLERLAAYSASEVLDILSRLSLSNATVLNDPELQEQIRRGLFGEGGGKVFTAAAERVADGVGATETGFVLFHQLQILNLLKVGVIP